MLKFMKKVGGSVYSALSSKTVKTYAVIATATFCTALIGSAHAEIDLPLSDVVADVTTLVTAAITVMGGVVAVCIGGQTGFALLKKFGRWIGKALS